jgi:serine protease Do
VVEGGPADKAGLKPGDIVTKFNGKKVTGASQLRNNVAATAPNTRLEVEIYRDGKPQVVSLVIAKLDQSKMASATPGAASNDQVGINVETLTPELARQLGYDGNQRGVVVSKIDSTGIAARAGVRTGDVVVAIGDRTIETVADFREAMADQDLATGVRLQIKREGVGLYLFLRSR